MPSWGSARPGGMLGAMTRGLWVIVLCGLSAMAFAADEVYRYVAPDGSVHYTDRPPSKRAKPLQLPPLSGPAPTGKRFYTPEALRAAARFAVSIDSPTPGQVLRAGVDRAVAAANVMPGLVSGFRVVYFLDGRALEPGPVDALSVLLPALGHGEHSVSAAVLDANGREVARSEETHFVVEAPK